MDVRVLEHPDTTCRVVAPTGQLDMQSAPTLSSALERLLDAGERRIVIDLSGLTFCDSIGLSTLILAHRSCVSGGGFLRLAGPNPFLLHLLEVVGISGTVGVYADVPTACAGTN